MDRSVAAIHDRQRFRQFMLWTIFVEPMTTTLGAVLVALALVAAAIRLYLTHYEWAFLDFSFAWVAFAVRVAARGNGSQDGAR